MLTRLSQFLGSIVLLAALVHAQARDAQWDALIPLLRTGESLQVTDTAGRTVQGRVVQVTSSRLDLITRGNQPYTIDQPDVVRITGKDSNLNGMMFGLLGGLGVGAALGGAGCGGDSSCSAAQLAVGLPVGAGVGLFAGYAIDRSISRKLFERGAKTVAVRPEAGKRMVGASVTVGWH